MVAFPAIIAAGLLAAAWGCLVATADQTGLARHRYQPAAAYLDGGEGHDDDELVLDELRREVAARRMVEARV